MEDSRHTQPLGIGSIAAILLYLFLCPNPFTNPSLFTIGKAPPDVIEFALEFGRQLKDKRFNTAHGMLNKKLQKEVSVSELEATYLRMISYFEQPVDEVSHYTEVGIPTNIPHAVGWVYVAIEAPGYSEAVTVIVTRTNDELKIAELTWGRP